MKIVVSVSEEELSMMKVTSEKLQDLIIDKIDSIRLKKENIIHQTELNVEVVIKKINGIC